MLMFSLLVHETINLNEYLCLICQ